MNDTHELAELRKALRMEIAARDALRQRLQYIHAQIVLAPRPRSAQHPFGFAVVGLRNSDDDRKGRG